MNGGSKLLSQTMRRSNRLSLIGRQFIGMSLLTATGCGLWSCISYVTMRKVYPESSVASENNPPGIRVKLPAPFIVGTKSADTGNYTYKVLMLPDPDQEYAIKAWAIMAKQKLALKRSIEMYMKEASLNVDTIAVAKAMTDAAGQIVQTALTQPAQSSKSGSQTTTKTTKTTKTTTGPSVGSSPGNDTAGTPSGADRGITQTTTTTTKTGPDASPSPMQAPNTFKQGEEPIIYAIKETATGLKLERIRWSERVLSINGVAGSSDLAK